MKNGIKLIAAFMLVAGTACAEPIVKKLPEPVLEGGHPLMEVFKERKTVRKFSSRPLDDQTLSEILWSAWGISHNGKRTIPTAKNEQNLKVYVIRSDGAWLYDAKDNALLRVSDKNLMPYFNQQNFMKAVPVNLLYTGSDAKYSPMHAGSAYQNVGLYAADKGLHNVVRGYFDADGIKKALNLQDGEEPLISQAIGW